MTRRRRACCPLDLYNCPCNNKIYGERYEPGVFVCEEERGKVRKRFVCGCLRERERERGKEIW